MENNDPVVCIGGLGGSGTRIYAAFLNKLGIHIGHDLNNENDNLLFTRLLKNPSWYDTSSSEEIKERLELFKKISVLGLYPADQASFLNICMNNHCFPTPSDYDTSIFTGIPAQKAWGWKEPNSYFYLENLAQAFPAIKYILVVRNGLDMSMSKNTQQLTNWGNLLFGLSPNFENEIEMYTAQLDFWLAANERALELGHKHLKDNFYVADFDKLCQQPAQEIRKISAFLGYNADDDLLAELASEVRPHKSLGRYQRNPYPVSQERLDRLTKLSSRI